MRGGGNRSGGPKRIGGAGVVITVHIDRFFRGDSEAVATGRRGYGLGQVTDTLRAHATINETQSVPRTVDHVILRISHGRCRASVSGSCGISLDDVARGQGVGATVHLVCAHGRGLGRNREIRFAGEGSGEVETSALVLLSIIIEEAVSIHVFRRVAVVGCWLQSAIRNTGGGGAIDCIFEPRVSDDAGVDGGSGWV